MQHSVVNLLSASLIPILAADISAGAAYHIHGTLITVMAAGALPDKLVIILYDPDFIGEAALLAVIASGIHFRVHDVIIDITDHGDDGRDVVLHIRDFHIADCSTLGERLKIRLKGQLGEGIDLFRDTNVIAVGDIVFIRYAGDDPETLLKAFCEFIGCAFQWRSIDGKADVGFLRPAVAGSIHYLQDGQRKLFGIRFCVGFAGEIVDAFSKSGISEGYGGIAAVK